MRGGIYRLKEHLAHVGNNVKKCTSATPQALEAKEKCKKAIEAAKRKREEKTVRELELREEVNVSRVGEESEEVTCVGSSQPHKLGPIDKWTRAIDPTKADSFKQQQLNKELWKEREHEVHKFIARWAYNHGIPFNACDNDEFKQMCEAIGQFGPGLTPPTQDAFRGSLLEEEYERTKCLLQEREAEKMKNVCSIMTDAWKVIDQAKSFTIFVYGHTRTLECLRYFTEGKELVRPGVTRFVSYFLTLNSMQEKKDQLRKMVVHSRWDSLKDVKSKKGKEATTTILSPAFWKDVKLMLAVFEPLVKVLRLVDGDVKPSMGFLYGELLKAKREVKEAFGNVESRFKDVMAVIEKKMNGRLDSPLHLTAFLLNPHYSYANPSIFDEPKMNEAFISCVEQFYYHDEDQQEQAVNFEFKKIQNREGPFSKKLARTFQNYDYNPVLEVTPETVLASMVCTKILKESQAGKHNSAGKSSPRQQS
ncbi:hAT transposon superfamily protein [Zea mays]|uniref:HAT transposon superfamily protein n=1 Tax=Zea mays TaxID=4577 RepID=A0A1D6QAD2_MAIZE|nr:hAT transposon superfamily protein [Zea mays]